MPVAVNVSASAMSAAEAFAPPRPPSIPGGGFSVVASRLPDDFIWPAASWIRCRRTSSFSPCLSGNDTTPGPTQTLIMGPRLPCQTVTLSGFARTFGLAPLPAPATSKTLTVTTARAPAPAQAGAGPDAGGAAPVPDPLLAAAAGARARGPGARALRVAFLEAPAEAVPDALELLLGLLERGVLLRLGRRGRPAGLAALALVARSPDRRPA